MLTYSVMLWMAKVKRNLNRDKTPFHSVSHATSPLSSGPWLPGPASLASAVAIPDQQMKPTIECMTQTPHSVSGWISHGIPGGSFCAFITIGRVANSYSSKMAVKSIASFASLELDSEDDCVLDGEDKRLVSAAARL